ncbi:hypothetical protein MAR_030439 [Mya arenaria]|uniref:Uncharacterized protein n=1 Tax=Mya arenaria TaxID=6604 RepID=A0ABY7F0Z2_MYAAR|nr:hypothetical protein MAR_030439 [Mya arenaria]
MKYVTAKARIALTGIILADAMSYQFGFTDLAEDGSARTKQKWTMPELTKYDVWTITTNRDEDT